MGRRIAAHREQIREVLAANDVANPQLFGSVARGDDNEHSDVDMLVDFPGGTSILDILRIQHALEDILGSPVDLVSRTSLKARVRAGAHEDLIPL